MAATLLHKAPFLRLLAATAGGILLQRHAHLSLASIISASVFCLSLIGLYSLTGLRRRFRFAPINGVLFTLLFVLLGCLLVWHEDVRNREDWVGRFPEGNTLLTLQEPLVEKPNSFKAEASVDAVIGGDSLRPVTGSVLVYFKKDSALPPLDYGSRVVLRKPLQVVKNAGNPGSFDYKAYCLYGGITHQVFLSKNDFVILPARKEVAIKRFIFQTRAWVVHTLRTYIRGEKEQGLAEALLIGYKDDLDKNLVQAYSNTGVVHIIAISGLHLGLIYWLLMTLTRPLSRNKKLVWLRLLVVVASLWTFTLLAGAQPSVLRSAVMFTVIAMGEVMLRRSNIFNTLACSAMVLLCVNPFWLWDVGFQLSYSAVLSIVLFFQPVYRWFLFRNKAIDFFWKLTAVTIAAQVLTLPISVYHFHQLPLLFLFANFVAVPLSSVVLLGEILLCALAVFPPVASFAGKLLSVLIGLMNAYVERLDSLPFAVWNFLSITAVQAVLLLVFALAGCYWLMERQRRFARLALASLAVFMVLRGWSFITADRQQKLVVYNVPRHSAVDLIAGRQYVFVGDTVLLYNDYLRNFHLQPSRILHRTVRVEGPAAQPLFLLNGKRVLVLQKNLLPAAAASRPVVDLLVLSKNPKLYLHKLAAAFNIRQVVLDSSVPPWKARDWKRDCDALGIRCHNVADDGAFVLNW